jgi:hypothetical protein
MRRLLTVLLLFAEMASATNYYISPTGSDSNAGTSSGTPWKTFAHAIPLLNAGDTLNLANGTYNSSNSGFPNINCSSGAHNGTSGSPITIQALNERQAFLAGDGTAMPFQILNCSYWNIIGLHIEDGDFPNEPNGEAELDVINSSHLLIQRNIVARDNGCSGRNDHPILLQSGSSHNQIIENEGYIYRNHFIALYSNSNNNEVARNYSNWRHKSIPSCAGSGSTGGANDGFGYIAYGSSNNIFENNIDENGDYALNNETITSSVSTANIQWLGNIGLNNQIGARSDPHSSAETMSNITWKNNVFVHPSVVGLYSRATLGAVVDHVSAFLTSSTGSSGITADTDQTSGTYSFTVTNSTAMNGSNAYGFKAATSPGSWSGSFDHVDSYGNGVNFSTGSLALTNSLTVNPAFGSCYLWVPATSPLHGAGSTGDIGANILYQYVAGSLTGTELWDASTGAPLFEGATVTGLNDVAGNSLFDIANRLNINHNSCAFPAGYGGASVASTPTFSPVAGSYSSTQNVTISSASGGAVICYNTTGSPATNGSTGCTTGTHYTTAVSVSTSETLYAVAGGTGFTDSTVGSAAYTIGAAAGTPTFSPVAGSYTGSQSITISTTGGAIICWNTTGAPATNGSTGCTTGTLYSVAVTVASSETLYAVAGGTGFTDSGVGSAAYVISGSAAEPTFSPAAGYFYSAQSVAISTTSGAAIICWNTTGSPATNGSTGCTIGTLYSSPVTASASETLYAVAGGTGYSDSTVGSAAYFIIPEPPDNRINLGPGRLGVKGTLDITYGGTGLNAVAGAGYLFVSTGLNIGAFHQVNGGADCGDATHAIGWTASTQLFGCQTISGYTLPVVNTRRTCMIVVGADNGSALVNADLGPQLNQCFVPFAATVVEIEVMADAGTPNVIVQRSHLGTPTALLSGALATASAGAVACSNTGGTTGLDGTTTCTNTLQNTSVAVGDWIGLTSGTAGGTAKRMSAAVTMTVN